MTRTVWLFAGYAVLSVLGLLLLRAEAGAAIASLRQGSMSRPVLVAGAGAACYVVGFGLWVAILAHVPLSKAYPVAVGLTLSLTSLCAVLLLGEQMTLRIGAGCLAVFVGVCLLATG